nr:ribosomal L7Ae/L30e/S12e/Gadd45 family protein [uncultured Anaeromusa sp.]
MKPDAFKVSRKVVGIKQVSKAVERNEAVTVYVAADAEPRLVQGLLALVEKHNVPLDESATMQELGQACGIEVGASAVALLRDM